MLANIRFGAMLRFLLIVPLVNFSPASARDLHVLIRLGYAAFLAEQGAAMCNLERLPLSDDERALFRGAQVYAAWVKQQISTGLPDEDARYVIQAAAGSAHTEIHDVVKALKSSPPALETRELFRWCAGTMKGVVEKVISAHVNQPGAVEQMIAKAKAD